VIRRPKTGRQSLTDRKLLSFSTRLTKINKFHTEVLSLLITFVWRIPLSTKAKAAQKGSKITHGARGKFMTRDFLPIFVCIR
jgi:hypothetical protein